MACQEACGCCKGACCYEAGGVAVCEQQTCQDCELLGGQFQGVGTACNAGACPCDPPADHLACEKCEENTPITRCDSGQHCCDGICQDEPCESVSALAAFRPTDCAAKAAQSIFHTPIGNKVVQVWRRAIGHCGIGDCLRGALEVHRLTRSGVQDYTGHPVAEFVVPGVSLAREVQEAAPMVLVHAGDYACLPEIVNLWRTSGYTAVVFSNAGPAAYKPLSFSKEDRNALAGMLVPNRAMELELQSERYKMPPRYRAFQFRTFDDRPPTKDLIAACISQVPNESDVWVLASSEVVRDAIKAARPKVFTFAGPVAHTGKESGPGVKQSLLEFWLLGQAEEVQAFSVYEWISNYAVFAAARGGVPLAGHFLRRSQGRWYAAKGAGTELKKLLARIGIRPTPSCACARHAAEMDINGVQWCRDNIETIDGWLAEEAKKRKMPYIAAAGKMLIQWAIRRAS